MIKRFIWPAIVATTSLLLFVLVQTGSTIPLRAPLTLWFLLVCPGMPFAQSLRIRHWITRWTLAIALSISIGVVVSLGILYAGAWSPILGLNITIAIAWAGIAADLLRSWQELKQEYGVTE